MPIVDELEKLGKSGMKVTERYTTQDGHKVVREFMHYVFVSTCLADIPAKNKVGDFRGVGSKVGSCSYCLFEGQPIPGRTGKGSVTRYLGARGMELLAGDPKIALSHQDLIKRGHKLRNAHLRVVRASYKMEEWAHFVETFSAYLFDGDVLPGPVKGLWFLLIDIVEHYFRPRPDEETRDEFELASRKAYDQLHHFAAGLEELESGADYMMTTNLHIVVCRCVLVPIKQG
ncbi:hypothetical protein GPECTOR_118g384 [Gonium pectorale]|uniref:Uncharacterized protein n=1 Tax=Gonium pectorale TaxID=33097 RepID=A0A150FYX8_GONPE|nr:hypothetical protein GPECTOR_118g384 [Gonium pectorale]|eukprot:KXZ42787.1 hypothetical protein GPECTOR_118g384 [Gonium pectorale]